jgi:hypothetical protein
MRKDNLCQDESHRDGDLRPVKGSEHPIGKVEPDCNVRDIDRFKEATELEIAMMLLEALTIG